MTPRIRTVLIGVDLTAPSLAGAEWTARVFAPHATLVLAHALEPRLFHRFFGAKEARAKAEAMREGMTERLEELRERLGADRIRVVVANGSPGTRLVELAAEEGADLIAVGAHRESLAGGLLGSATSSLLGAATIPVLIAHSVPEGVPRRVLVAIDESNLNSNVLAWACTVADTFGLDGEVMSAIQPGGVAVSTTLFSSEGEFQRARDRLVERTRLWVEKTVAEAGLDPERFAASAVYGRPEAEVSLAAERMGAELLVVGTRGHKHARTLMIGSVSRRVIEASECPVLVVPPPVRR